MLSRSRRSYLSVLVGTLRLEETIVGKKRKKRLKIKQKTYNTGDSLVVTDPTTSPALRGLCLGERTGPSVLHELWSYVLVTTLDGHYQWQLKMGSTS